MGNAECGQAPRKAVIKLDGSQPWEALVATPDGEGKSQIVECCCTQPACERVVKLAKVDFGLAKADMLSPQPVLRTCIREDNPALRAKARFALETALFDQEEGLGKVLRQLDAIAAEPGDEKASQELSPEVAVECDEARDGTAAADSVEVVVTAAEDPTETETDAAKQAETHSLASRAAPKRGGPAYDDWQFSVEGDPPGEPTLLLARFKALPARSCRKEEPDVGQAWHALEAYALEASGLLAAAFLVEQACCEVEPAAASRVQTVSTVNPRAIGGSSPYTPSPAAPLMVPALPPDRDARPLDAFYGSNRDGGGRSEAGGAIGGLGLASSGSDLGTEVNASPGAYG